MCFSFCFLLSLPPFPSQATGKSSTTDVLIYPIQLILSGSKISVLFLIQQFLCLILRVKGKEGRNTKLKKKSLECRLKLTLSTFLHSTSNNVITIKWCFSNGCISGFHVLSLPFFLRFQVVLLGSY